MLEEGKTTTDDKLFSGIFTWKMPVNMLCKKRQSSVQVVNKFGRENKWRNKWLCFLDFIFGQYATYFSNIMEDLLKSISIFTIRYDSFCIALDFEINFLNFNSAFFTLNVGVKKTISFIIMSYMSLLKQLECDNIYLGSFFP